MVVVVAVSAGAVNRRSVSGSRKRSAERENRAQDAQALKYSGQPSQAMTNNNLLPGIGAGNVSSMRRQGGQAGCGWAR